MAQTQRTRLTMYRSMTVTHPTRAALLLIALVVSSVTVSAAEKTLVDLSTEPDLGAIPKRALEVSYRVVGGVGELHLTNETNTPWPGMDLKAPEGKWDLSAFGAVLVEVRNVGSTAGTLCCRVDNPGADGKSNCVTGRVEVEPGAQGTIRVDLPHGTPAADSMEFIAMRGTPLQGKGLLNPANVTQLVVFVPRPSARHTFAISSIRAAGEPDVFSGNEIPDPFFPMIDEFGQYMHKDWPGKTHSVEEMRGRIATEAVDNAAHPAPDGWNRFGGWRAGPQLEATGCFRAHRHGGKWWLVDPDGRLFWSNGIDGVRATNATPITDREHYFAALPDDDSPPAQFYSIGRWAPKGYYKDKGEYRQYDFTRANLLRKYGEDWQERFADVTHRRFRSWGINTMANWSSEAIYLKRRTPYVVAIHYGSPDLRASKGMWKKFSDVFDPGFREGLARRLAREVGKSAGDRWCIGYFVDNELGWGNDTSLALATLRCPPDQAAKKALLKDLKQQYGDIAKLNAAWSTDHASWQALLESTDTPDPGKAGDDLRAFYTHTAETYFRTVREEVKRVAPNQLYLGCRFSNRNDRAVRAAARFCDVLSFNRYTYSVKGDRLPTGIDRPMIIGEFHFGALDRGMFHTGLRKARDQAHRAELYAAYVRDALRHPGYVGAHWFIYKDQATTGRGDGENYQIGFVDNCDTPYPEIIAASRAVAADMYRIRAGKDEKGQD